MDKTAKHQFEKQTLKYIEKKKIYDLLESLMRKLALNQPENPLDFLIDTLTNKKPNFVISVISLDNDIHKACGNISLQLNLKHISIDDVINKEIQSKSKTGQELQDLKAKNQQIPDEKVNELILQEFKGVDKFVNGVLLENYPLSLRATEFLKNNRIVLDRVFFINEETIAEKIAQNKISEQVFDVKEVLESLEGFTFPIDSKNKTIEKYSEEIVTMLNYRLKHSPPLRPPRILILNPLGASFEKTAAQIAQRFGLVHIDGSLLLNKEIDQKSRIGGIISECYKNNELVPDDLLCGLVYNEITKSTAKTFGWVLTSFPINLAQFNKFLSWELHPHFVLRTQVSEGTFTKSVLESADVSSLNYTDQVFVRRSRKDNSFFNTYVATTNKLKQEVDQVYPDKTDSIDIDSTVNQAASKIGKILQNPVYYD